MAITDSIAAARDQLNRTMTFFPRVDGKASVVLAVNTSILALMATKAAPYSQLRWDWIPIGLTLLLLAISFWNLYKEAFPHLEGGQQSRLYFREIAALTEAKYLESWNGMNDHQYLNDLLSQVWRNSEILTKKFNYLKKAYTSLALALVPWLVLLVLLAWGVR